METSVEGLVSQYKPHTLAKSLRTYMIMFNVCSLYRLLPVVWKHPSLKTSIDVNEKLIKDIKGQFRVISSFIQFKQ